MWPKFTRYTVVTNGKTMIFHTGTLFADAIPCACSLFWLQSIFNNAGKSLKIKSRKTNLGQLPTFLVKPKRRNILLHFNFNQLHCHPHPTLYHKLASKFMEWRQVATYTWHVVQASRNVVENVLTWGQNSQTVFSLLLPAHDCLNWTKLSKICGE